MADSTRHTLTRKRTANAPTAHEQTIDNTAIYTDGRACCNAQSSQPGSRTADAVARYSRFFFFLNAKQEKKRTVEVIDLTADEVGFALSSTRPKLHSARFTQPDTYTPYPNPRCMFSCSSNRVNVIHKGAGSCVHVVWCL
jgi:hypothetical protein